MMILAIESTCDETSASIVQKQDEGVKVISNVVASSVDLAIKYGGVVPEVAAREQVVSIIPVIEESIKIAAINLDKQEIKTTEELAVWAKTHLTGIAVSYGPGLMGSLLVGAETARVLSKVWGITLYKVNHLTGHMSANWIINEKADLPTLPAIGLIVSGGHTDIVYLDEQGDWKWVGGTRDDAAGEAFDKAARLLGLPYPGGPAIQAAAQKEINGINKFSLPRPMIEEKNLDMSFSGLKTAVNRLVNDNLPLTEETTSEIAKEFNEAVAEILTTKALRATEEYGVENLLLAGGVAANRLIRERMEQEASKQGVRFYCPEFRYCTDNAAMIGAAALLYPEETEVENLKVVPNLSVEG